MDSKTYTEKDVSSKIEWEKLKVDDWSSNWDLLENVFGKDLDGKCVCVIVDLKNRKAVCKSYQESRDLYADVKSFADDLFAHKIQAFGYIGAPANAFGLCGSDFQIKGSKIYLNAQLGSSRFDFVLDTGSEFTLLNNDLLNYEVAQGNVSCQTISKNQLCTLVNGYLVNFESVIISEMKIAGEIFFQPVIFLGNSNYLGMDYLSQKKFSINLDLGRNSVETLTIHF
jgi:hypothetical protein